MANLLLELVLDAWPFVALGAIVVMVAIAAALDYDAGNTRHRTVWRNGKRRKK